MIPYTSCGSLRSTQNAYSSLQELFLTLGEDVYGTYTFYVIYKQGLISFSLLAQPHPGIKGKPPADSEFGMMVN